MKLIIYYFHDIVKMPVETIGKNIKKEIQK